MESNLNYLTHYDARYSGTTNSRFFLVDTNKWIFFSWKRLNVAVLFTLSTNTLSVFPVCVTY